MRNIKIPYIVIIIVLVVVIVGAMIVVVNQRTKTLSPSPVNPSLVDPSMSKLPQDQNGNFVLYVSNQSPTIDPVDVKIFIDGEVAVEQNFYQGGGHNWQKFQFSLTKGEHAIYAISIKGEAKLEKEFEIKDKHWAAVDYFYSPLSKPCDSNSCGELQPRQFGFHMQDEPIYFE